MSFPTSQDISAPATACRAPQARQGGFTLLEVMCAFTILAMITGVVTMTFVKNVEKGATAVSWRELREAADTIFRKMIYEWHKYDDGHSGTLDEEYGRFARLSGYARDRWSMYRCVLEKKDEFVVGTDPEGAEESYFDADQPDPDEEALEPGEPGAEGTPSLMGIKLIRLTLRIYKADDPTNDAALLVLSTWIDPHEQPEEGVQ